jgi:primase-polymerase (primpol)-like protein
MTEKPKTFCGDLAHLPQALRPLTEQKRWVVWPWELRKSKGGKEKWTKPPRQARDPAYNARSNDPDTWGTYDEAVAAVAAGSADGIGYMLLGSGIGAIDVDHVAEDGDNGTLGHPTAGRGPWRLPGGHRLRRRLANHRHRQRAGGAAQIHF